MAQRNILDVIKAMKDAVPTVETAFHSDLDRVASDAGFTAPEAMRERWDQLATVLHKHVNPPPFTDDWKFQVISIFVDRPMEDIKKDHNRHVAPPAASAPASGE